ncbi:DNA polymerase III subunit beta [Candidatus Saccharibacteria bacterium]|nr:DNA polymerase III subunit beta [Candidatus Saccharibacteria bacterium]
MEIEVTQEKLSKALNNVSRVAVGKVTLPILNNVLIRVEKNKISLVTTNLDMAVVDFLPVSESKDGTITVPARLLAEFISTLPKGETIKLSSKDDKITISAGKYSSIINGTPADDFPELPEIDEKTAVVFKMGVEEFKNSINQVIIASSNDLTRPALTGVYFNTYDNILAVASTDGYRLAEKKIIKNVQSEINVIVPTATLQEVLRAINEDMEEIEISFNEDLVRFRLGEVEIISKIIDASFPDYQKLIPKDNNIKITIDREELTRVTKLAALFARRSASGSIILETKKPNILSVRSVASELGENDSNLETEVTEEGKINLNSRFLLDALNVLDEKNITAEFANRISPIILKDKKSTDYTHIIMPLNQ